jgi:hypothetical protein
MRRHTVAFVLFAPLLLAGCELLGIESPEKVAAARDAEGRAVGGACRHAGRAIEDCFALNRRADKAAVFAGWRDMNDYMRENKIAEVPSQVTANAGMVAHDSAAKPADDGKAKAKVKAKDS